MRSIHLRFPLCIPNTFCGKKQPFFITKAHKVCTNKHGGSLIILITFLTVSSGFSQIRDARREMSLYNYSKAVGYLQKSLKSNNPETRKEATILLAECYSKKNDVENARIWYGKTIEFDCIAPINWYYYAEMLRSSGMYSEAKKNYLIYDSLVPADLKGMIYATYCDSAISWQNLPLKYKVNNVSFINSPQSEFGVVCYRNSIIFASDRIISSKEPSAYGWTGYNYLKLYQASFSDKDTSENHFNDPQPFSISEDQIWHDGPAAFSSDYNEAFINRTILSKDPGRKDPERIRTHLLKIFTSVNTNGKWTETEPFFLNSNKYSVGHPALSTDGKILFFISDMPGGYGETDIWYCKRENDLWSLPVNPGSAINTFGKEMFPFVAANGDLYFASDGLPGFGGLDLFVTRKVNENRTNPENLGREINTSYDDFSLATKDNGKTGFFSSNRPGGSGSDDIYYFSPISPPLPIYISGYVKDKTTLDPLPESTVFLRNQNNGNILVLKTDEKGYFRTSIERGKNYICKAMKTQYIPDCLSFYTDSVNRENELSLPRILLLDKLEINKKFILENIYYDFDQWNIRSDAESSLDHLVGIMKENPVNVELGSHTDCRGTNEYNRILSQKRAESAVAYIVSKGVDPSRITAKGYGKSQLINSCDCSPGKVCNEEEHQSNRRTEFRITGWTSWTGWTVDQKDSVFVPEKYHANQKLVLEDLPAGFFEKCKMN